jgi:hypothetical protein
MSTQHKVLNDALLLTSKHIVKVTVTKTIKVTDRIVDYNDIYNNCELKHDDWHESPWDNDDALSHECEWSNYQDENNSFTWSPNACMWYKFNFDTDHWHDTYDSYRNNGYSKQDAKEEVAQQIAQTKKLLNNYYQHGWDWYAVEGEYEGYEHSYCGILGCEDKEYHMHHIAGNIAYKMTKDGYIVKNMPKTKRYTRPKYKQISNFVNSNV